MVYDYPYRCFRHKRFGDISDSEKLELCLGHLENATPLCKRWKVQDGRRESEFLKCNCLQILLDTDDEEDDDTAGDVADAAAADTCKAVALYILWFYNRNPKHRKEIITDWIRYTSHEHKLNRR